MAGHSHAANIAHRKGAQDKKRAKIFTKYLREIQVAAKLGGVQEEMNPRLRVAISKARAISLPKDRIEAVLKKVSGGDDNQNFDEVRYDGYANGGIGIVVEALTDNKNRTASDVRSTFTKHSGNLGETGSLNFAFSHYGVIYFKKDLVDFDKLFDLAVNEGADSVEPTGDYIEVLTSFEAFNSIKSALEAALGTDCIEDSGFEYRANTPQDLSSEQQESLQKLIDALEDLDDVQNVWC
jgi:YebC/PmpR family DNA-binding regulatory protein